MDIRPIRGISPDEKRQKFFIDLEVEWPGMNPFRHYNWRDFTIIALAFELDAMTGRNEFTIGLLGFVVTFTSVYDDTFNRAMELQMEAIKSRMTARAESTGIAALESENAALRHDVSRSMANHSADLTAETDAQQYRDQSMDNQQAKFESWMSRHGMATMKTAKGQYTNVNVQDFWECWKAAMRCAKRSQSDASGGVEHGT